MRFYILFLLLLWLCNCSRAGVVARILAVWTKYKCNSTEGIQEVRRCFVLLHMHIVVVAFQAFCTWMLRISYLLTNWLLFCGPSCWQLSLQFWLSTWHYRFLFVRWFVFLSLPFVYLSLQAYFCGTQWFLRLFWLTFVRKYSSPPDYVDHL